MLLARPLLWANREAKGPAEPLCPLTVGDTGFLQTDSEALDLASWIIAMQAEPSARFETLTINLYKMTAAMAAAAISALDTVRCV